MRKLSVLFVCLFVILSDISAQLSVKEILNRNENLPSPAASEGRMKMILISKDGSNRERVITSYSVIYPNGDEKRSLVFDAPADVKNTRFLTVSYGDKTKEDDQYIYIPSLRKVRSIGVKGGDDEKTGAFLGSDFTYADIGTLKQDDFIPALLGKETIEGKTYYKVELKAKSDTAVKKYGYGKVVKWIDTENFTIRRNEFYDRDFVLVKRMEILDTKLIDGVYWLFSSMEMTNLQNGHRTKWIFEETTILPSIDEKYFTMRFLERGR